MTKEEKLLTMRNLWEDMRESINNASETSEIIELLDQRVTRLKSGEASKTPYRKP